MRLYGITKSGLLGIALSVGVLWTCVGMQQAALHRGRLDARFAIRELQRLRNAVPAALPVRPFATHRPVAS